MRTRAIILKKQNIGEYDQLVICYTEEFGKVTAVAKSALKPNSIQSMHLDVFSLVNFELINGHSTPIITGAQEENTFRNIKKDLASLSAAYLFTEIVDKLAFDYQKDKSLWGFMSSFLEELNLGQNNLGEFVRKKQVEFLDILGYAPNLEDCTFCAKSNLVGLIAYNVQARGIVCRDCFLSGQGGIAMSRNEPMSRIILNSIFEALAERKLWSLNLLNYVLK